MTVTEKLATGHQSLYMYDAYSMLTQIITVRGIIANEKKVELTFTVGLL